MKRWVLLGLSGLAGVGGSACGQTAAPVSVAAAPVPAYRESGPFVSGMKQVRFLGVTTNDQILLGGDRSVVRMDPRGNRLASFPSDVRTHCLACGQDGRLYLGVGDHVEVRASDGQPADRWPPYRTNSWITAIAVSDSDVFVADAGSRIVLRYSLEGKMLGRIGGRDPARKTAGFIVPSPYFDLALDKKGILYVTNPGRHRVEGYTKEGELVATWGQMAPAPGGFYGCCNPSFLTLLANGQFVTSAKGYREVNVYDASGQFLSAIAGSADLGGPQAGGPGGNSMAMCQPGTGDPFPIAADSQGRILVLDRDRGTIRVFEPVGHAAADGGAHGAHPPAVQGERNATP